MNCPKCQSKVSSNDKFCQQCGSPILQESSKSIKQFSDTQFVTRSLPWLLGAVLLLTLGFGGKFAWSYYWDWKADRAQAKQAAQRKIETDRIAREKQQRIDTPSKFVGETITSGHWEVRVESARFQDSTFTGLRCYGSFFLGTRECYDNYAYPTGKFLIVTLNVKNISIAGDNLLIGDESFTLMNESGAQYKLVESAKESGLFSYDNVGERINLEPQFETTARLVYDVPTSVHQYKLVFQNNDAIGLDKYLGIGIDRRDDNQPVTKIVGVVDGSPAATAGILPGDIITELNGLPFTPERRGLEYWGETKFGSHKGELVKIYVTRNGEMKSFEVALTYLDTPQGTLSGTDVGNSKYRGRIIRQ